MEVLEATVKRRPGRPLGFDRDLALHEAMLLFGRHGYEATSINDLTAAVQEVLRDIRVGIEERLRKRIEVENRKRNLETKVHAEAMASYIMALIQGMSTLARDGAERTKLMTLTETAMQAWPL